MLDKDGYEVLREPVPGKRGKYRRALVHRRLIERHIGRSLSFSEVVHHKNGVRTDNRIENLEIMSRGEHVREHAKPTQKRICIQCDEIFLGGDRKNLCSTACHQRHDYLTQRTKILKRNKEKFDKLLLSEKRKCQTCSKPLRLAHRNRKFCLRCSPWPIRHR